MKTDISGISTCPVGIEHYEPYIFRGKNLIQYDYRTDDGKLFSCVASTLEDCRAKMHKWLIYQLKALR